MELGAAVDDILAKRLGSRVGEEIIAHLCKGTHY